MATINFYIQSSNKPAGIYVRLRDGVKIDAKTKTKFAINPEDWSTTKGQPKNLKDESFKKLHCDLENLKTDLLKAFNNNIENTTINSQWLKEFINPSQRPKEISNKLVEYIDYYAFTRKTASKKLHIQS